MAGLTTPDPSGCGPGLDDIVANTISYLMREKLRKTNKKIVGDKSPFTQPRGGRGDLLYLPLKRVVHIVRDGRDGCVLGSPQ